MAKSTKPLLPSHQATALPTYAEPCEEYCILWCLLEGDCRPFKVAPPLNFDVDNLKEVIHAKGIDTTKFSVLPKDLVLWKLREPEPLEPDNTFARRARTKFSNLSEVATEPGPWKKLSALFPQQPLQDCLHIIIQMSLNTTFQNMALDEDHLPPIGGGSRPTMPYTGYHSELPSSLQLNCVVYGESTNRIFTITVKASQTVTELKEAIKEMNKNTFQHIDVTAFDLWKVSIPIDDNFQKNVGMQVGPSLMPVVRLSTYFPEPPVLEHLHIIVKSEFLNSSFFWLIEIYSKLWGNHDLLGQIFRTATLTKADFIELQSQLQEQNPDRNSKSYVAKNVLAAKSAFLRSKSTPYVTSFGNDLVPQLDSDTTQPPSSGVLGNDGVSDDDGDDAMDSDSNYGYADSHTDHLSNEATAIFPYTIRYVDLTVLNLKHVLRVPLLMLFRNEWDSMIDLFNKRTHFTGRRGSAVFTGQPGIGKTCLLYSILILCMIRGRRFVFQDVDAKVFVIDDTGIKKLEDEWPVSGEELLALVDADTRCCEPNQYLLNNFNHRILLTSSPRTRKDRWWLKQYASQNAVFTMKPWAREEFVVVTLFLQMTDITLERLQQASLICGNIPRPCFEAAVSHFELDQAEKTIKNAIEETEDLSKVAFKMQNGDSCHITHRAFQVHPESSEDRFWHNSVAEPISAWAFMEMLNVLHKRSKGEAYRFYCTIKGYTDSSQLCGKMFEYYFHPYLKPSRTFIIKSLDNRAATLKIDFIVDADNHLSFTDLSEELVLSVKSNKSHYLRPESLIFPSFSSFLYQPEISHSEFSPLIALQVTTTAKHAIKLKGLKDVESALQNPCLENLRPEQNRKMIILFVVPKDLETTFRTQKIQGAKKEVAPWYNKTVQYVLGLPEEDLFEFHETT